MPANHVTAVLVEACKPYQVRTGCGHIVIRKMREATAGVSWNPEVVLEAPNGAPCDACAGKEQLWTGTRLHTFRHEGDKMAAHVYRHGTTFAVTVQDVDSGKTLPAQYGFPTEERAITFAKHAVNL